MERRYMFGMDFEGVVAKNCDGWGHSWELREQGIQDDSKDGAVTSPAGWTP